MKRPNLLDSSLWRSQAMRCVLACLLVFGQAGLLAQAQDAAATQDGQPQAGSLQAEGAAQNAVSGEISNPLADHQAIVAERFKRLEELLLKSAEIEAASDPSRAALMQQAAQLGKQTQLSELLARAAERLEKQQYTQALEDQKVSRDSLKQLLELLQSENRQDRVREQRDQVRRWIEETDRLRRLQSSLRGRTEGGQQTEKAASDQSKLSDKATQIAQELEGSETSADPKPGTDTDQANGEKADKDKADDKPASDKPADDKPTNDKPSDDKPSDDKPSDDKPSDDKPVDENSADKADAQDSKSDESKSSKPGETKPSDSKSGEPKSSDSKPGDSQSQPPQSQPPQSPTESQPSESQPGESPPNESGQESQSSETNKNQRPPSPTERAAERIKRAQKRMQEAKEQLDDAERQGAIEKQREAEQELQAAIEQLEEILRQLREEEIERSLAALEDRLRLMLQSQNKVLEETERLQEISGDQADRQVEIRASNLSLEERKILTEGQRALLLLREEGTSAAFPEAMAQMLLDIQSVVDRLAKADTGKMTVSIENEIVSSLEEMIEAMVAVQKDQKKRKEQRKQSGQQSGAPQGDQPLVDQLAEMRLILTLQKRVNKRTQSLSEVLKDPNDVVGQADAEDIQSQLRSLAERQGSIKQVTRDIVIGKTK